MCENVFPLERDCIKELGGILPDSFVQWIRIDQGDVAPSLTRCGEVLSLRLWMAEVPTC